MIKFIHVLINLPNKKLVVVLFMSFNFNHLKEFY